MKLFTYLCILVLLSACGSMRNQKHSPVILKGSEKSRQPSSNCVALKPYQLIHGPDRNGAGIDKTENILDIIKNRKGYQIIDIENESDINNHAEYLDDIGEGQYGFLSSAVSTFDVGSSGLSVFKNEGGQLRVVYSGTDSKSGRDSAIAALYENMPTCHQLSQ